jgi:CSLREA domain-containing protein
LKALSSLFVVAVCLLALPATSLAEEFTVDSLNDEPDNGGLNGTCQSAGLKCTLRAAIEESNNTIATRDTITFSGSIFEGLSGDTIAITSSLVITNSVRIDGHVNGVQCNTSAGVKGPCAEISGPPSGSSLVVENVTHVEIEGLAITGATGAGAAAINVINSSEEFEARGNWIGVKLDGSAGANNRGIFLDPNSNDARIGGTILTEASRNVFANNSFEGLDIEGADNAEILGNYFGVRPDGVTAAANGKNIEITDTIALEANGNEVGRTVEGPALLSEACDGGCNVIAGGGLSTGIDLQGNGGNEEPATGPTTIHGNYVGLGADGTAVVANGTYDILVQAAEDVTVGGEAPGDANYIAGGGFGIYHENGEGFAALGNVIGGSPAETAVTSPGVGIFLYSPSTVVGPLVAGNVILMSGGFGVEAKLGGATIVENFIQGGNAGIFTVGLFPAVGNLIAANTISEATFNGILIEGDENEVLANEVVLSGGAGVKVKQAGPPFTTPTTGNVIGGESKDSENLIFASAGPAIEIVNLEGSQNEVARNRGSENDGLFIDLRAFEPGTEPNGPNGGIKPPTVSTASKTEASGTADPEATVRVFSKATTATGELGAYLGKVTADSGGKWQLIYLSPVAGGTFVAATQTNEEGGTSEVSDTASVPPDPPSGGGGNGGGNNNDNNKGGKKDTTPPDTKITKGPPKKTHKRKVTFKFTSTEGKSTFQCKLDRKPFKACSSPKTYKKLIPGKHVFKVRAIDKAGNVDPTPAKRKFTVLR